MNYDKIDIKLLIAMQRDASLSVGDLADEVGISKSACWRRIQRLEGSGVIAQKITVLNPEKLGLKLLVFISIRTNQHNKEWAEKFKQTVAIIPDIVEVHRMGGQVDYLIKAMVRDMVGYDRLYQRLIHADLFDVNAGFVVDTIKMTNELPIFLEY